MSERNLQARNDLSIHNTGPPEGTMRCRFCGRNFNIDRVDRHEKICRKLINKERKVFDLVGKRAGEKSASQAPRKRNDSPGAISGAYGRRPLLDVQPRSSNWRQNHEELIATIRDAKEMQSHLARGGKLSDLPPPPPTENPDYIECPHCHRRFNEAAAARHIPLCANMQHNKPRAK